MLYILANGEAEYSVSKLAESLGSSRKAVHAALRHLVSLGLLLCIELPKGSKGGIYRAYLGKGVLAPEGTARGNQEN